MSQPTTPAAASVGSRDARGTRPVHPRPSRQGRQARPRQRGAQHLQEHLLLLVLRAGRCHLLHHLHRPDGHLLLLRLHPLGPVHGDVDRTGQLPAVLRRAVPADRTTQHPDLRRHHQRPQGRPRDAPGGPADSAAALARVPPLGRLLPGPGQHGRGRHHLRHDPCPGLRPAQQHLRQVRDHHPGLPRPGQYRAAVGGGRRCLEGRRPGDRHLHRRHHDHPPGLLRGRRGRRRRRLDQVLERSPCRWPSRRPSRSSCCRSSAACAPST